MYVQENKTHNILETLTVSLQKPEENLADPTQYSSPIHSIFIGDSSTGASIGVGGIQVRRRGTYVH